jgi:hypothetical protein
VVAGEDHIRYLGSKSVRPLLPEIPIGFVQDTHITAKWASLVGNFSSRKRGKVILVIDNAAWQSRRSAIVANRPVRFAGKYSRVPVICVADITAVPGESNPFLSGEQ